MVRAKNINRYISTLVDEVISYPNYDKQGESKSQYYSNGETVAIQYDTNMLICFKFSGFNYMPHIYRNIIYRRVPLVFMLELGLF